MAIGIAVDQVAVIGSRVGDERSVADIVSTIPLWWERRAATAGLPGEWRDWRRALAPAPRALNGWPVAKLLDVTAEEIGDAYVRALEPKVRLSEGRHYTPSKLSAELWRMLVTEAGQAPRRVVDPACGAAALLLPVIRDGASRHADPATFAQVSGTDIDPVGVWLGNAFLAAELLPWWASIDPSRRARLQTFLTVGDGLVATGDAPDAIVMNPPYGRIRLTSAARQRWARSLYGHSNRYAMFLHAAIERVAPGGWVAAVLPTSFLGGAYYQRLRAMIAEDAPLVSLTFVEERNGVFSGDPLQETCLAVFHRSGQQRPVTCRRLNANGGVHTIPLGEVAIPAPHDRPWPLPRRADDAVFAAAMSRMPHRLSDYGWSVSTGPLVWNRHKPQIGAWGKGRLPILWAGDIDASGEIRRDPARDHQRWIRLRPKDEFMRLEGPAVLVQRTTAPEQPRRLIAGVLDQRTLKEWGGAVVAENHVNVLRSQQRNGPLSPSLLARLLATPTFDAMYRCLTGSVAVSAYEIEALPLPPPDVLMGWSRLSQRELCDAVACYYGG